MLISPVPPLMETDFHDAKDGKVYKITANEDFEKTMLYRMMILSENNLKHFELVYEDYPYMVLYKVK